jgi:RNA polymerase primary sigma factor
MRQLKVIHSITNRDDASLDKYLSEISKIPQITANEEAILARKIREGDNEALDRLTKANLRFVVSVAKQYQRHGLPLIDLINEGNLGLIKAAKRFDEMRGFKFISYAVWWIRQSIYQSINDDSRTMRVPLNQITRMAKISKATAKLQQDFEREPTVEEIAEMIGSDPYRVATIIEYSRSQLSLDMPFTTTDTHDTLLDMVENFEDSPDQLLMNESLQTDIVKLFSTISERERKVLTYYFGLNDTQPVSLDGIAEIFNLTRERARQIRDGALVKLKRVGEHRLRAYL